MPILFEDKPDKIISKIEIYKYKNSVQIKDDIILILEKNNNNNFINNFGDNE